MIHRRACSRSLSFAVQFNIKNFINIIPKKKRVSALYLPSTQPPPSPPPKKKEKFTRSSIGMVLTSMTVTPKLSDASYGATHYSFLQLDLATPSRPPLPDHPFPLRPSLQLQQQAQSPPPPPLSGQQPLYFPPETRTFNPCDSRRQ